jgi:hypothetical protein
MCDGRSAFKIIWFWHTAEAVHSGCVVSAQSFDCMKWFWHARRNLTEVQV